MLSIETTDGRTFTLAQAAPLGAPDNPMSDRQFQDKFRSLAQEEIGAAGCDAILESVANLEEADVQDGILAHVFAR